MGIQENIRIQNDHFVAMENLDWIFLFIFFFFDEDEDVGDDVLMMMLETSLCLYFSLQTFPQLHLLATEQSFNVFN